MIDQTTSIDEILLPRIRIDDWARSDSSPDIDHPSVLISAALTRLNSDPRIHAMLVQINDLLANVPNPTPTDPNAKGVYLKITSDDLDRFGGADLTDAQAAHVPYQGPHAHDIHYGADSSTDPNGVAIPMRNALIYLEARDSDSSKHIVNSFKGVTVDGYDANFSMSLDRMLFHELVHILTRGPLSNGAPLDLETIYDNRGTSDTADDYMISYSEDVATIGENFLYVPYAKATNATDTAYRLGHTNVQSKGGSPGMDAFSLFTADRMIQPAQLIPGINGTSDVIEPIKFVGSKANGDSSSSRLTLEYHRIDHEVGKSVKRSYDHYLLFEMEKIGSSTGLYTFAGNTIGYDPSIRDILSDSLVQPSNGLTPYDSLMSPGKQALDTLHSIAPFTAKTSIFSVFQDAQVTQIRPAHLNGLDRMVTISAERHVDKKQGTIDEDVTGPVNAGTLNSADLLIIDQSQAATGSLIFGGSGYTRRYDFDAITSDPATDGFSTSHDSFASSTDHITGSDFADVIVLGTGSNSLRNFADGGSGHDVIVGREADDYIVGGIGDDILIGGRGRNIIDGGDGFDIVSYADATSRVSVGLFDPINWGSGGVQPGRYGWGGYDDPADFRNDDLRKIEGVIGSAFNDDLRGRGGSLLIGGEGDDTFYLRSGDIAIGGGGHDTFILLDQGYRSYNPATMNMDGAQNPARYAILDLSHEDTVRPTNGWPSQGPSYPGMPQMPPMPGQPATSVSFDFGDPTQPGRVTIAETRDAGGYYPGPGTRPTITTALYEIFVSDLQSTDFVSGPSSYGPSYTGPSYDFHDLFGLFPII